MREFESVLINLLTLFGDTPHKIPLLQRKYVWQEDDVRDLLEDIESSLNGDPASQYFIGGMVFSQDGGEKLLVVDGQQRLTTIMLLLSSASQRFQELNRIELVDFYNSKISRQFLDSKTGNIKKQYFLELHENDNPTFTKLLQGQSDDLDLQIKERSVSE